MRTRDQEEFQRKKIMLMEKCYDCYAENGLASVGIRKLAESCGCSSAVLYIYFRDLDDLICPVHRLLHGEGGGRLHGQGPHRSGRI